MKEAYNWEEIFQDKTNKELYDIYLGKSQLPKSVIPLAKQELEIRNFDFDDMETNRAGWKLAELLQEEAFEHTNFENKKIPHISITTYLIIEICIVVFLYIMYNATKNIEAMTIGLPMLVIISSLFILTNNFDIVRHYKKMEEKRRLIDEISKKLESQNMLHKESPIQIDIKREEKKFQDGYKFLSVVMLFITLLFIIIKFFIN